MAQRRQYQVWTKDESDGKWWPSGVPLSEREACERARFYGDSCTAIALPVGVDPVRVESGEITRYGDEKKVAS